MTVEQKTLLNVPKTLISHIFSYLDFTGKLYFGLTSKKYHRSTKELFDNFTQSLTSAFGQSIKYEYKNEYVWLRLCIDGYDGLMQTYFLGWEKATIKMYKSLANNAARYGLVDILQLLLKDGYEMSPILYEQAIIGDQLRVLDWLELQKINMCNDPRGRFVSKNHVETLNFLKNPIVHSPCNRWACSNAAQRRNLPMLMWLRKQTPPYHWNEFTSDAAAKNGDLKMMEWLRSQDPPCPWNEGTMQYAVKSGNLLLVRWMRSKNGENAGACPWNEWACNCAAENGDLTMLQYLRLRSDQCPWDKTILEYAIKGGNSKMLEWIKFHLDLDFYFGEVNTPEYQSRIDKPLSCKKFLEGCY
jgi:hypothetical protein